ncbi:MAG: peptide-methionine (S)-S-oxide reductase MsrA [Candidatus Spechtbacterales bacterium]|nr:peptide-methionine (S)-S-oxide reductase MsrA [Candidatus Spechtbacterales bacterium]
MDNKFKKATLAGGCFWCIEAIYKELRGVVSVISGYSGGDEKNPSYEEVSSGSTGHVEAVQIEYNPELISYKDILDIFWTAHDPTQENGQGTDIGPQYRAVIFYHDDEQKKIAEESKEKLGASGKYKKPIATKIKPFTSFYEAEDYHQDYYESNKQAPYCRLVINPKLKKLRNNFNEKLKEK